MTKIPDPFVLRADSGEHGEDVRWVAAGPMSNQILSASRDKTSNCFSFTNDSSAEGYDTLFAVGPLLSGHKGFVNFVLYHPSVAFLDGEAAIITGSNDKYLIFWSPSTGQMEAILGGHTDTVKCATILYPTMDVVSGGWDKAAVVWDIATGGIKSYFMHHEQSILSVAQVGARNDASKQTVVTASGDRTLVAWDATSTEVIRVFKGHTDSVQTVLSLGEDGRFASGANDGRIGIWHVGQSQPLFFLQAHESFIYSLAFLDFTSELVSSSEDHTVKVWGIGLASDAPEANTLVCTQVINFPTTVWSVAVVPDESVGEYKQGLVTGTADGFVRLWTRNMDMCADAEKIVALEEHVSSQQVDVKTLVDAGYKVRPIEDIVLLSACAEVDGQYEGERKLFKLEDNSVELYTWASGMWAKIGSVIFGEKKEPYRGVIPKQRYHYDGEEWDYLFDIQIGRHSLKLPYRSGEPISEAAQRFVFANTSIGVSQAHKEEIQQFILKGLNEEDLAKIGVGGAGVAVSAYAREAAELAQQGVEETPSWGQAKKRFEARGEEVAVSAFALEEAAAARAAAMKGTAAASTSTSTTSRLQTAQQQLDVVESFSTLDPAAVKRKTAELAGGNQHDAAIDAAASFVANATGGHSADHPQLLETAIDGLVSAYHELSQGSRFPAIDVLRYVASTVAGSQYVVSPDARCSELVESSLFSSERAFEEVLTSEAERLVALRLIANIAAFACPSDHKASDGREPSSSSPAVRQHAVTFLTKAIDRGVRPMLKRQTINANQKLAVAATLKNISVNFASLVSRRSHINDDEVVGEEAFARSYFLAIAEAILFEKDTAVQAKYLGFARTALSSVCHQTSSSTTSSSAASVTPNASRFEEMIKTCAANNLRRFCQGSLGHTDRTLASAASAVYQFVKPDEDIFE